MRKFSNVLSAEDYPNHSLVQQNLQMDSFFIYALMKDIVSGLSFIHTSFLEFHGHLTSEFCLIDDRWQIKLAYYGPKALRNFDKYIVKGRTSDVIFDE